MRIACIQMTSGSNMEANIAHAKRLVARGAEGGAQLAALPENVFLMEEPGAARVLYTQDEHPGVKGAAEIARAQKLWLLVGSVAVKIDDSGKTVNRSLLFDDQGTLNAYYDKIHMFDVEVGDGQSYRESAKMIAGNKLTLAQTPWGKLGMTVCYDVRFPGLYRALAKGGADILAVPAAFTKVTGEAHWHALLRARAIENGCFVIAPAQCGTHPGKRKTFGHALIIDPWGKILADAGDEDEDVIFADLDMTQVAKVRAKSPSLMLEQDFS